MPPDRATADRAGPSRAAELEETMKVQQLMTKDVATCSPLDDLTVPARLMWEHDCGCVPVVDSAGRVEGMITDRDVCMAAYTSGAALRDVRVFNAMSKTVVGCRPDDDVVAAEEAMRNAQVRRLPVMDEKRKLLGLITLNDLACEASDERVLRRKSVTLDEIALTLATVGAHRQHHGEELAARPLRRAASAPPVGASS
jgi:CBS domain-containing protein